MQLQYKLLMTVRAITSINESAYSKKLSLMSLHDFEKISLP